MNDTCPDPRPNRADSVMEMIAEIDSLRDYKRKQAEDIMTLGQEVGRLRAALEPFAAEAPKWDAFDSNEPLVETWNEGPDTNLTVADLRSARAALKDTSS